jgi:uncharacterized protein (DUF1330 family)
MSVYLIFSFNVIDRERFAPYGKAVTPLILKYSGELLAADFSGHVLEGKGHQANVVIRFPSHKKAAAFYQDPDYAPIKQLRAETTSDTAITLVKSFVDPARL